MPIDQSLFLTERRAITGRTILQIVPELDSGGAEQTTLDMAHALIAAGARALVATRGGRLVAELQALGGEFHAFPASTKNPLAMAINARRLAGLIRREGVDIIHARSRAPAWVAYAAAQNTGIGFVTTCHGAYGGASAIKQRYNSVMARGDRVIANSAFTAATIASLYPEAAPRLRTIPRGTDMRAFSPANVSPDRVRKLRMEWEVAPHERILLLPARIAQRKGHDVLIDALALLAAQGHSDLVAVFVGDTGKHEALARRLRETEARKGLSARLRWPGHCDDMPAAYLAAAVATSPSTAPESFGRVAVEAQAMGTPIVVSDIGASAETVATPPATRDALRTGWRVGANDAAALAHALGLALDLGAAARDAMGLRARAHVSARFSRDRMCADTLSVYEDVLANRNPPGN